MTARPSVSEAASAIARAAHHGQVDKQGRDYYNAHLAPIAAMLRPFGEHAEAAGWLHDILEDTNYTAEDLEAEGMPDAVVEAVISVSRLRSEPYTELIARAAAHPLSRLVKLADNWHNLSTIDQLDPATATRLRAKYTDARRVLEAALTQEPR